MILVDTSVWIEHFRGTARAARLLALLETDQVLMHPWILGELALGGLGSNREAALDDLRRLPAAPTIEDAEVLELVLARQLSGRGIGWIDAQLLAAALVRGCGVWTFDAALAAVASDLGLAGRDPSLSP